MSNAERSEWCGHWTGAAHGANVHGRDIATDMLQRREWSAVAYVFDGRGARFSATRLGSSDSWYTHTQYRDTYYTYIR